MTYTNDMIGKKYGTLTVIDRSTVISGNRKRHYVLCNCDCGNKKQMRADYVKKGGDISCGCLRKEKLTKSITKHGLHDSREYRIWSGIKRRCYIESATGYKNYGGKGIKVCDRWLDSFENFYKDMGKSPSKKHSIDRINPIGDYEPSNCRWADIQVQSINTKLKSTNTSGVKGVGMSKAAKKWQAYINANNKRISLGVFSDWFDAVCARKSAENKYHKPILQACA